MIQRFALLLLISWPGTALAQTCATKGVQVQVLGSGGPEMRQERAGSSYLVWLNGKARVLIDVGGGSALRFGQSGAAIGDLDVILFTHLHADHTAALPALINSARFERRTRPLPIYGPSGNKFMPSTVTFVRSLFDKTRGAYRYLGEFLSPLDKKSFKLKPHDVRIKIKRGKPQLDNKKTTNPVFKTKYLRILTAPVIHGAVPALAWRIEIGGKTLVFSGDTDGASGQLAHLAQGADLLLAHHAVAETATPAMRALHMPPSTIGSIAGLSQAKQLVLSHRMLATLGKEKQSLALINKHYTGPVALANDLDCFHP